MNATGTETDSKVRQGIWGRRFLRFRKPKSPPVIAALMFAGRIGPLTLLAAAARQTRRLRIQYPTGNVVIG